jgi:flagellar basal body-associated protein FliL
MSETSVTRKAALWVGVVFLLGAALGGMLGYVFAHRSYASSAAPLSDSAKRQQKVAELTQEANLTDSQRQQLDVILNDMQAEFKTIRKQTDPQIDAARQKGRDRIRAILAPDQRPKFEDFLRRLDAERKKNAQ